MTTGDAKITAGYGLPAFPVERAAEIAVRTVSQFLRTSPDIDEATFCCFSEESAEAHRAAMEV